MSKPTHFTEQTTIQKYVIDLLRGVGWQYVPAVGLHRKRIDVLLNEDLTKALIRLNPCIAEKPERADCRSGNAFQLP